MSLRHPANVIRYCTSTHVYIPNFETYPLHGPILPHQLYQTVHQQFLQALFLTKQRMKLQLFPVPSIATQLCLPCNKTIRSTMQFKFLDIKMFLSLHSYRATNVVDERVTHSHLIRLLNPLTLRSETMFNTKVSEHQMIKT